jgi:adenylate kinase
VIVIFFGPPGSGKGTQAAKLAEVTGMPHISTGEMLRAEVAKGTPLGAEAMPIMERGGLVPDDLMVRIIQSRLDEPDAVNGVILDGFPRTVPQAERLDTMLEETGREVGVVLYLDVSPEFIKQRILKRAAVDNRADDTPEALAERMVVYERDTAPVIAYYQGKGTRIEWIDGKPDIENVTHQILTALGHTQPSHLNAVS